jgi:hypothetical protein
LTTIPALIMRAWTASADLGIVRMNQTTSIGKSLMRRVRAPGIGDLFERCYNIAAVDFDQHDAFTIAAWLSRADRDSILAAFLNPDLSPPERTLAQVEGWILGVPGLIRTSKGREDSATSTTCDTSVCRLH